MTNIFKNTEHVHITETSKTQCWSRQSQHYLKKKKDLPTDSMQKSKVSSEASFLLDFSFPCRFTIFTNS